MSIIKPESRAFRIVSGEHKGKRCVIRVDKAGDHVGIVFADGKSNTAILVRVGRLAELETPGWPDENHERSYGLREYCERKKSNGSNMLYTPTISQPRALMPGDILTGSGEVVVEAPRRGFNSSVLIRLDKTGWVELAPRLPIALHSNKRFRFPDELAEGNKLATGCLIIGKPYSPKVNWTTICLDWEGCEIEVPSCIPLALR
ncbi:hypothetical protein A2524_01175 [Candidatus Wolfebacteria bacterium RIFOXYD12_FULL_48_21]|uniref:Uncharacterized protein n=1 Tax=Candidatus Wolfebacteria bacterium RIFOXYD1_FULL_48_65 TaxID=1802561 RepID=A0A1F8E0L2_9BACT|nr:MAG: hypothetical protein A2610_03120 [Candidatus Wolfebacteria bacterium RIFOXYD1_FULL_48_65]OGM94420.1 MAG: hypothetical protein A2524_01175 [Candidatus Wolfebacteria bacterium RIFOXYD12_FULL_48_21]OGM97600.1 MAG: hypothetical protein A2532_00010 [Candidatus Wolfebacteria bacterium RIFOXYD2_FULL_48_11]